MNHLIEAHALSKFYGQFMAVSDISFQVDPGSITAFLGPNGAGKSTCMKMLIGYLAPSAGTATLAGHDMSNDRLAGSKLLGYLSEHAPLYPDMTAAAYLRYIGKMRGMSRTELQQRLSYVIEQCQIEDVLHKAMRKLSKGYRQRVGLAQAILHNPRILILDEPTAGLDPNQIAVVRDMIRNFAAEDRAVLLSTHILQEVESLADKVLLIHQGNLRYDGDIAGLTQDQNLESSFRKITQGVAT
ncbi:MAG: ABC transporter ATP-binding protein [Planctomycetes bacterium]|nr:ABC transporter ATP-binding protein [Planctomycetota bacterium]